MSERTSAVPDDSLQVSDHTKIIEFVLKNYKELSDLNESSPMTSVQMLEACADLARASEQSDPEFFSRAAVDVQVMVQEHEEFFAQNELPESVLSVLQPLWQSVVPVIFKIIKANSLEERIGLLELESRRLVNDDPLRAGIEVAKDILIDGADTIYSPETDIHIVLQYADPRAFIGHAEAAWNKVAGEATELGKADVLGALQGAAKGVAKGIANGKVTPAQMATEAAKEGIKEGIKSSLESAAGL